jgi:hypothetical protein
MADEDDRRRAANVPPDPSLRELLDFCRAQHAGFAVSADDVAFAQQFEQKKLAWLLPRVTALAFRDLATLVSAVEPPASPLAVDEAHLLAPLDFLRQCGRYLERLDVGELVLGAELPDWHSDGDDLPIVRLCAMVQGAWSQVDRGRRERAAGALVMVGLDDPITPDWADLRGLADDLVDADVGEPDEDREGLTGGFDLMERYWRRREALKKPSGPPLPTPPRPYSPQATFEIGQWVEHPTFGVGWVRDVRDKLIVVAFGDVVRRLAHLPRPPSLS